MLRDECASPECGHSKESHFEDTIETGNVDQSFVKIRAACTMPRCDCGCYVPPTHTRK